MRAGRSFSTGSAVIMVPTPEWVNSSSSVAARVRREIRCARPTPAASARSACRMARVVCAPRPASLSRRLGLARGQLAEHRALAVGRQPVDEQQQLVRAQRDRHVLRDVLPGQVEHLAGGRIAERAAPAPPRPRPGGARWPCASTLRTSAGELVVHALHHADRARGDEVAGGDADRGARHRRIRQPLREQRLDLYAQHARRRASPPPAPARR